MKKNLTLILLTLALSIIPMSCFSQSAMTSMGSLNIVQNANPPILSVVDGSLTFNDPTGNQTIDANEACYVEFDVTNTGIGKASGCQTKTEISGTTAGVFAHKVLLPDILVGDTFHVKVPITSNNMTDDGLLTIAISVIEPLGFGIAPFNVQVKTRAFEPPSIQVVDYGVKNSSGGTVVEKADVFELQIAVQNIKMGNAKSIKVGLDLPQNVYLIGGKENATIEELEGGKAELLSYKLVVNNNYETNTVPIKVNLSERYGKFAESRSITLPLNQPLAEIKQVVFDAPKQKQTNKPIQTVTLGSDVDKNIPLAQKTDPQTFVLIIANENYQEVAPVPFALNDGNIFKQYCVSTLGIQENHIYTYSDATLNNMRVGLNRLTQALQVNANAKAIIYYTGHGIPDEGSRCPYLLPIDGIGNDVSSAFSIDTLYARMGRTGKQVTIFLDACFSGTKRDGDIAFAAKGIALRIKSGIPRGKTVVFSASTGDETAGFYQSQSHGMFTYWLLKAIQSNTELTYGDLAQYLNTNVPSRSLDENGKVQTPTVANGDEALDWQSWTLK